MPIDTDTFGGFLPAPPPIVDVAFDQGAAAAAVAAVDRALGALDGLLAARATLTSRALRDAEGPFATHLGEQVAGAQAEGEGLWAALVQLRVRIEVSADRAATEQARREDLRASQTLLRVGGAS